MFRCLGYFDENSFTGYDSKLLETEKVLGYLIRSLRSPNRLQSKQPEWLRLKTGQRIQESGVKIQNEKEKENVSWIRQHENILNVLVFSLDFSISW